MIFLDTHPESLRVGLSPSMGKRRKCTIRTYCLREWVRLIYGTVTRVEEMELADGSCERTTETPKHSRNRVAL